jgi:hypothetical protein
VTDLAAAGQPPAHFHRNPASLGAGRRGVPRRPDVDYRTKAGQLNALQAEIAAASAKYDYQSDRVQLEYQCGTDLCIRGIVFSGHNNILSGGQD